jgi:RimJ/RimL family protein N-acetyltransferase
VSAAISTTPTPVDRIPKRSAISEASEAARLGPLDNESHAAELREFVSDDELHTFVPYKQLTLEEQRERCARWAKRKSPDGKELWLNWFARDISTKLPVVHFQSGLKEDGVASIGYVVARKFQDKGCATEAAQIIFEYLQTLQVRC